MPELPDVEVFRQQLAATSLHQEIEAVAIDAPKMLQDVSAEDLRSALLGTAFETTHRHGKYLFAELARGPWLVLHFGMTGRLDYTERDAEPPRHARLTIDFENGHRLAGIWQRRLGKIGMTTDPKSFVAEHELGPDALGLACSDLREMLARRRGGLKSALMDQAFIAGLGNVYTDEILFHAGLDPARPAADLGDDVEKLHRATRHVLELAIERRAEPERLPDTWLLPHRKSEARCPRCGTPIDKVQTAERTGYRCPDCQG